MKGVVSFQIICGSIGRVIFRVVGAEFGRDVSDGLDIDVGDEVEIGDGGFFN